VAGIAFFSPRDARAQDRGAIKGPAALVVLHPKEMPVSPATDTFLSNFQDALRRYPSTTIVSANRTKESLTLDRPDESLAEDIDGWKRSVHQAIFTDSSSDDPGSLTNPDRLNILKRLLGDLEKTNPSVARWKMYELATCYLGMVQWWMIGFHEQGAPSANEWMETYLKLLRTRPELKLSESSASQEMDMLEKARKKIKTMKKVKLTVESDPADAEVWLDGVSFGKTPFSGEFIQGKYHLQLVHPSTGKVSLWVNVGTKGAMVKASIALEQAIDLSVPYPALKLAKTETHIPPSLLPALSNKLGTDNVITVVQTVDQESSKTRVGVVDLSTGSVNREAEVATKGATASLTNDDIQNLAFFVVTGKTRGTVEDIRGKKEPQKTIAVAPEIATPKPRPEMETAPVPTKEQKQVTPWYRRWYWWAAAGAAFVGGGVGATVVSESIRADARADPFSQSKNEKYRNADALLGVGCGLFAIGAGAIITGIVLDLTYQPPATPVALRGFSPLVGGIGETSVIGLQWGTEF
jgi:hypothetical protein